MEHQSRANIMPGLLVEIVLKKDQGTSKRVCGTVQNILTPSATHPYGIKVRLSSGQIGRVQQIIKE